MSLALPSSLLSQTAIIKVDYFMYEKGIQFVEEIINRSVPVEYSLISNVLLKGIKDILHEDNSFVIISNGKQNYEKDPVTNLLMVKGGNKDSFSLPIEGIESKAIPGYGFFGFDPYMLQK